MELDIPLELIPLYEEFKKEQWTLFFNQLKNVCSYDEEGHGVDIYEIFLEETTDYEKKYSEDNFDEYFKKYKMTTEQMELYVDKWLAEYEEIIVKDVFLDNHWEELERKTQNGKRFLGKS